MRDTTERPEAVEAGTAKLIGTEENVIFKESQELIKNTAREFATNKHIYDYKKWKDITFYNTIKNLSVNTHINNILSIGDAVYERNALKKYGQFINNKNNYTTYIKTIKKDCSFKRAQMTSTKKYILETQN